jgi:hypothetical protein
MGDALTDHPRSRFVQIPLWVLNHPRLACSDGRSTEAGTLLRVYTALCAESSYKERVTKAPISAIVERTGLGKSAIYQALATLRDIGATRVRPNGTLHLPLDDPTDSAQTESDSAQTDSFSVQTERDPSLTESLSEKDTDRPEVVGLCDLLAGLVEANGSRRPSVTKAWLTDSRLMLDVDQRTPQQVETIIRWSQADPFWRANILSMAKLRKQFDRLRLARNADIEGRRGRSPSSGKAEAIRTLHQHLTEQEAQ